MPQVDLIYRTTFAFSTFLNRFKSAFLVCLTTIAFTQGHAQNWQWAKKGALASGAGEGWLCAADPFGGVVAAGFVQYGPSVTFGSVSIPVAGGMQTAVIVKYDAGGNVMWAHGTSHGTAIPLGVTTDRYNNTYLFGKFDTVVHIGSYTLTTTGTSSMSFLAKYDPGGNLVWAKKISDAMAYFSRFPGGITTDYSGNVYITESFSTSPMTIGSITLSPGAGTYVAVAKLDSSGTAIWAKFVSGSANAGGIAVSPAGSVYVGYDDAFHVYINKYSNSGTLIWKDSATCTFSYTAGVAADLNDNAYLAGVYTGTSIAFGSTTLTNSTHHAAYIVQYAPGGTKNWVKQVVSKGNNLYKGVNGLGVATDSCNNVWVLLGTGQADTLRFSPIDSLLPTPLGADPLVIAGYSQTGTFFQAAALGTGGEDPYIFGGIATDPAGNVFVCADIDMASVVAGSDSLSTAIGVNEEIYVAKFRPKQACGKLQPLDLPRTSLSNEVTLYPNPTTGTCTISTGSTFANGGTISIYDVSGRELRRFTLNGELTVVKLEDLPIGLYICRIFNGFDIVNRKLIIAR